MSPKTNKKISGTLSPVALTRARAISI